VRTVEDSSFHKFLRITLYFRFTVA